MHSMTRNIAELAFCTEDAKLGAAQNEAVTSDRDWADIRDSLAGDPDAYARLVARYQRTVFQQMWRFTRDVHDQDELVQDVFVEVYRSLANYRGDAPFLHWVRRIATRVGYRYWKRQGRRQRLQEALVRDHLDSPIEPGSASASEAAEFLHELLAQLSPPERLILTLTYFENCSSAEIAERMGWNATLVRVHAFRARRRLKGLLEAAGFGRNTHE